MARYRSYGRIRSRMGGRMAPRHRRRGRYPLRVTPRVAQRLRAMGRADRFRLQDRREAALTGAGEKKINLDVCWCITNNSHDEVFQLNGMRIDFGYSLVNSASNNVATDGYIKVALLGFKAAGGTTSAYDSAAKRTDAVLSKNAAWLPGMFNTGVGTGLSVKEARRGFQVIKSKELYPPYLAKNKNDTRPDMVRQMHWNVKPLKLPVNSMIALAVATVDMDTTETCNYLTYLRVTATSGDISGGNQAPGYLRFANATSGTKTIGKSAEEGVWYEVT